MMFASTVHINPLKYAACIVCLAIVLCIEAGVAVLVQNYP